MKVKLTKKRQAILDVLRTTSGSLSASELHAALPHLDLTTIYRNLELFVEAGLIKQLAVPGREAQYEFQTEPHHHAVCRDCREVIHFTAPTEKFAKLIDIPGFTVEEVEVIVRGHHS